MVYSSDTIAIIGGADGPTAVFLSGSPSGLLLPIALGAAVILAAVLLFSRHKK